MLTWVKDKLGKDFTQLCSKLRSESSNRSRNAAKVFEWRQKLTTKGHYNVDPRQLSTAASRVIDSILQKGKIYEFRFFGLADYLAEFNWNANAGFPTFMKRKDLYLQTVAWIRSLIAGLFNYLSEALPTIMFRRTQFRNTELKVRLVFGAPHLVTVLETLFFLPLKRFLFYKTSGYVTGVVQKDISRKISSARARFKHCYDFKAFDLTLPHFVVRIVFEILFNILDLRDGSYIGKLFRYCENWFIESGVYLPIYGLTPRARGVPSGSTFTNMVGSLSTLLIFHYVMCTLGKSPSEYELLVHGDDVVLLSDCRLEDEIVRKTVSRAFDMLIKETTGLVFPPGVDECHFLGSHWKDGKPYRHVDDMLLSCIMWSGNFPMGMSTYNALSSRFISVLGYHCEAEEILHKLGISIPRRYFMYGDAGYSAFHDKVRRSKDRRGLFVSVTKGARLWETR